MNSLRVNFWQEMAQTTRENFSETYSVTFCECAENHHTMKTIGQIAKKGISPENLNEIVESFSSVGEDIKIYELNDLLPNDENKKVERAALLVWRKGVLFLLNEKINDCERR